MDGLVGRPVFNLFQDKSIPGFVLIARRASISICTVGVLVREREREVWGVLINMLFPLEIS